MMNYITSFKLKIALAIADHTLVDFQIQILSNFVDLM